MDEIEIEAPILKPIQFTAKDKVAPSKSLADRAAKPIIKNINKNSSIGCIHMFQNQLEVLQTKKLIN